jgi:hypothetical protein
MAGRVVTINQALVDYRQHDGNVYGAAKRRSRKLDIKAVMDNARGRTAAARQMQKLIRKTGSKFVDGLPIFDAEKAAKW